jgi:hypothetical protein
VNECQSSAILPREQIEPDWDAFLDPGIANAVKILNKFGIETFESCQGGEGHCYPELTVRFYGDRFEGFKAFAIAKQHGLSVACLGRIWTMRDEEPTGPWWEIVFVPPRANRD